MQLKHAKVSTIHGPLHQYWHHNPQEVLLSHHIHQYTPCKITKKKSITIQTVINFTETSNYFLFFKSNYLEKSLFLPILNKWAINQVLVNQNKKHQLNFVKIISIFQRAGGLSKYFDKTNKNCHFLISGLTSILDLPLILEYYTQLKNTKQYKKPKGAHISFTSCF